MQKRLANFVCLAAVAVVVQAAPALAQDTSDLSFPSAPESTVPPELQGMVGDWVLEQDDQSLPRCPVTLTDQEAIGGWAIALPEACPPPYLSADDLAAWTVNPEDGSVQFMDATRQVVLTFYEDEDGLFDTDPAAEPRFYLLAPYDADGAGGEADVD